MLVSWTFVVKDCFLKRPGSGAAPLFMTPTVAKLRRTQLATITTKEAQPLQGLL
jgi:hypothetical protein